MITAARGSRRSRGRAWRLAVLAVLVLAAVAAILYFGGRQLLFPGAEQGRCLLGTNAPCIELSRAYVEESAELTLPEDTRVVDSGCSVVSRCWARLQVPNPHLDEIAPRYSSSSGPCPVGGFQSTVEQGDYVLEDQRFDCGSNTWRGIALVHDVDGHSWLLVQVAHDLI